MKPTAHELLQILPIFESDCRAFLVAALPYAVALRFRMDRVYIQPEIRIKLGKIPIFRPLASRPSARSSVDVVAYHRTTPHPFAPGAPLGTSYALTYSEHEGSTILYTCAMTHAGGILFTLEGAVQAIAEAIAGGWDVLGT